MIEPIKPKVQELMIDTHAHIDFDVFDADRQDMMERARSAGLEAIIIPSVEPMNFDRVRSTALSDGLIYYGVGVHPHNANELDDAQLANIHERSSADKVIAIGEIGLDYYYDFAPKLKQQQAYREQLRIARETKLPAIVHNRESDEDIIRITREEQDGRLSGVFHCFSSDVQMMRQAVELGFMVSFTGNITFKKVDLSQVISSTPLDSIMLETDSPFMTPVPNRGKRNEPSYVEYVAKKIAEIKNISIEEVVLMTTKNAKRLFNLSLLLLTLLLSNGIAMAQSNDSYDYYDEEAEVTDQELMYNPYEKKLGIGFLAGSNTIVETFKLDVGDDTRSYEGLFAWSVNLKYGAFDFLIFDLSYTNSINSKVSEGFNRDNPPEDPDIDPFSYNLFELSSLWIPNPHSRINFYGILGATMMSNTNTIIGETSSIWALNTGLGLFINIPSKYGLFTVNAEWKLNFQLNNNDTFDPRIDPKKFQELSPEEYTVKSSSFYSIPRVGFVFFPKF